MKKSIFVNSKIKKTISYYRRIWSLSHAQALLSWDMQVNMPKMGIKERSVAQSEISGLIHDFLINPKFVSLVESLKTESLNEYEKGVLRVLERKIRIAKSLPIEFVKRKSKIESKAVIAWEVAKKKNNFKKFEGWLQKIIEVSKEMAEYLGYEKYPYDALLDLYEEGLRMKDLEKMFEKLEKKLRNFLEKLEFYSEHPLEKEGYEKEKMERVNLNILKLFGFPLGKRSRIDISSHPFTQEFGINDVRITTRYEGFDFKRSLLSTIHEFGHALYELQVDKRFMFSPIEGGVSLGIHESQSRFWENIIGRSKEFCRLIFPILKRELPFIKSYTEEDIYNYFNLVKPSPIRTEADEVTYNLHIILRYKLEKLMINEKVKAKELPEIWNEEMEKIIGIRPKNYREGILQDIHWSLGSIGYFPTYTLGTLLAAQLRFYILKEIPEFYEQISAGKFSLIKEWLREKIHRFGSMYSPKDLLMKSLGEKINYKYFLKYLKEKYF